MKSEFFCALLSQDRGERICGTAPFVERWILLEDRGVWNASGLPAHNLPDTAMRWLQDATSARARSRALLIRQGHGATGPLRCFSLDVREKNPQVRCIQFEHYEELAQLDFETAGEVMDGSLFLVCTHGRHDKCCARYGLPVYRSLRKTFGASAWECSHVAGDRFAANLLCFPHGLYYGHLSPDEAVSVARAYLSGTLVLGKYRGRTCYSRPAQVGEFFVRSEHNLMELDALALRSVKRVGNTRWRVRFDTRDASSPTFTAEFEQDTVAGGLLTCAATEPNPVPQYRSILPL
jgi:hypothetical protein